MDNLRALQGSAPSARTRTVVALTAGRDFQSRRRARHAQHRSGRVVDRTPPSSWDWSFETDGALALDRGRGLGGSRRGATGRGVPGRTRLPVVLKEPVSFATVPPMRSRRARRQTVRMRQRRARQHRIRRIVGLLVLAAVLLVTLLLTAFGTGRSQAPRATTAPASRLVPQGRPDRRSSPCRGRSRFSFPSPQERLSAIGYHAPGDGALPLEPLGQQANEGFLAALPPGLRRRRREAPLLPARRRPRAGTGSLDVGAPAGTDVYSPVDGTVVGLSDFVLDGERYGAPDRHPAGRRAFLDRLGDAAAAGSEPDGRIDGDRLDGEARHAARSLARGAAGPRAATRRTPATTSRSKCVRALLRCPSASAEPKALRILFVGDVFGGPGRRAVETRLRDLREELGVHVCIVNGENAADGAG